MSTICRLFGVRGLIRINTVLIRTAVESLSHLLSIYESQSGVVSTWYNTFQSEKIINHIILSNDIVKTAADVIVKFGLILTLRTILQRASENTFESILPGFFSLIESTISANHKLSDEALSFLEAVKPGVTDTFLIQRLKNIQAIIEPQSFFFFLGLLLGNPEWDDLVFDVENDTFTHNLHLIPIALEKIITLAPQFFIKSDESALRNALVIYFSTVGAVADLKREKNREMFAPFVILIDHFPSISKKINYGHMKHAFPVTLIRSCYNELANRH
jgi:hypothetical protein